MDPEHIKQLYLRYGPLIISRARALLRNEHAAQDALQEVFVRVLRAGGGFRAQASPMTWLYRVVTNYCLNRLRDERRRAALWSAFGPCGAQTHSVDACARIQLEQILTRVRPELQEIAIYALHDELSHDEIAELVGVSRRTIGNRLAEFRAEVATALALAPEVL